MTSASRKPLYRRSGTGWPNPTAPLEHIFHVMVYLDVYDDETIKQQVRDILGTTKGGRLEEALPLTEEKRQGLRQTFGREDLDFFTEDDCLSFTRRLAQAAAERRAKERQLAAPPARRTCLYRFHDDNARLLYVGVAYNPDEREQQHRASQRWAPLIAEREDEWFDTREDALRAESEAIRDESPLFNEAGRLRLPALAPEKFA